MGVGSGISLSATFSSRENADKRGTIIGVTLFLQFLIQRRGKRKEIRRGKDQVRPATFHFGEPASARLANPTHPCFDMYGRWILAGMIPHSRVFTTRPYDKKKKPRS